MNLANYITEYLQQNKSVLVPNFGQFFIETKHAKLEEETAKILPPTKKICFILNPENTDDGLVNFIVSKTDEDLFVVKTKIKNQVQKWNNELLLHQKLFIPKLGEFIKSGSNINFIEENTNENQYFFGLEAINLEEINSTPPSSSILNAKIDENNTLSQFILWVFLVILPIIGILCIGFLQRERLIGEKQTKNISLKGKKRNTIEKPVKIIDSIKIKLDSIHAKK